MLDLAFYKKAKMGRNKRTFYELDVLQIKRVFIAGLSEKQTRHFLGQEYLELGEGSQRYLA